MGATSNTSCAAPNKKGKRIIEDHDLGKPDKKKGRKICYICGHEGHTSHNCPDFKLGACFICGMEGHRAKGCPRKRSNK